MAVPYSEIVASTARYRTKGVRDLVEGNNAFLKWLTASKRKFKITGGVNIMERFAFAETGNVNWYNQADIIDTSVQQMISGAYYPYHQMSASVSITGEDRRINSGKEATIKLIKERMNVLISSMKNGVSKALYGSGTGKELKGLGALVPVNPRQGISGGINRAIAF